MSLLMDALKQAEEARKVSEPPNKKYAQTPELGLVEEAGLPPLPSKASGEAPSSAATPPLSRKTSVFEPARSSRLPLILAIAGATLLAGGIPYVWWATHPNIQMPARSQKPEISAQTALQQTPESVPAASAEQLKTVQSTHPQHTAVGTQTEKEPIPAKRVVASSAKRVNGLETAFSDEPVTSGKPDFVKRETSKKSADSFPTATAYEAYSRGDFLAARTLYADVLTKDPRNAEALNGLGTIALKNRQYAEAEQLFRRALAIDPRDATAMAQLTLIRSAIDASQAEHELRTLSSEQPNSPAALFSLGSLFARQGRWSEAQQAFFQAHVLDAENPDVLYNLAVSLDHLHQIRPAQQFYERALEAAKKRVASFPSDTALHRAEQLSSENTVTP